VSASRPLISVVCCAHNEEEYVDRSVPRVLRALEALKEFSHEIVFVADRCTDRTVEKVEKYGVRVVEKDWGMWRNGYAEALQTGFENSRGEIVGIVDVDILVSDDLFRGLVPRLGDGVASVDARVVTYPDGFWNRFGYAWERTYDVAPLGKGHYGGARVLLRGALEEIGGFRDVFSVDSDVDMRLAERGYKSVSVGGVRVFHLRRVSPGMMIRRQVRMGQGRFMIGYGFLRTVAHAVFRARPFVVGGWLMEWVRRGGR